MCGDLVGGRDGARPAQGGDGAVERAAPPAGETTVIEVAEPTVKLVAGVEPKSTALAPVKPVPVTMTELATDTGPETGLTPLTVGAAS